MPTFRWAIAGRSKSKLEALATEIGNDSYIPPVLVADASNIELLTACFSRGKVILNCTGPYRFLGEAVVKACIGAAADYMDICGEPQFMEDMFLRYHEAARDAGVLILHGADIELAMLCFCITPFLKISFQHVLSTLCRQILGL
jgi:short subunit dehydrogenase-like uncharacterized protein